jgi:hypothetical protein
MWRHIKWKRRRFVGEALDGARFTYKMFRKTKETCHSLCRLGLGTLAIQQGV